MRGLGVISVANEGIERPKMDVSERAKIFMPFNPLKGFQEALRAKEREVEEAAKRGDGVHGRRPGEASAAQPSQGTSRTTA